MQRDIAQGMIAIVKTKDAKAYFKDKSDKLWNEIKAIDGPMSNLEDISDADLLKELGIKANE